MNFYIPKQLRDEPRWIVWKQEDRGERKTKVPYQPLPNPQGRLHHAKVNDPSTWGTLEVATQTLAQLPLSGLGIVLGRSVISPELYFQGIDLDNHVFPYQQEKINSVTPHIIRTANEQELAVTPFAAKLICELGTYAELSPSETGIHIISLCATKREGRCKWTQEKNANGSQQGMEIYDEGRYFTFTGNRIINVKDENKLTNIPDQVEVKEGVFTAKTPSLHGTDMDGDLHSTHNSPSNDDERLVKRIQQTKNGEKFTRLWLGNTSDYPSRSEAHMAFCCLVAFWTKDPHQIDRIFRTSGLFVDDYVKKWDTVHEQGGRTYGEMTIQKALNFVTNNPIHQEKENGSPEPERDFIGRETTSPNYSEQRVQTGTSRKEEERYNPTPVERLVPPSTWLQQFLDYAYPTIDAPVQYLIFTGMSALSLACKQMYIPFGQQKIHPNLWITLVGASTLFRKTASINTARQVIEDYDEGIQFPNQLSPEAFAKFLSGTEEGTQNYGTFIWSELSSQLEAFDKRSYMGGFIQDLTDLYDCPHVWNRRTIGSGLITVHNPFVNILAGTTHEWLNQSLSEGNMKGGFLPRMLWVFAHTKDRHLSFPDPPDPTTRERLSEHLSRFSEDWRGGVTLSVEAKETYCEFEEALTKEAIDTTEFKGLIGSFYGRLGIYTLKFAMIYQADIQTYHYPDFTQRIIGNDAMVYAINLTNYLKQGINTLLENISGNEDAQNRIKVLAAIKQEPGIKRSRLIRITRLNKKKLDEAIETLTESDLIAFKKEVSTGKGQSPFSYYPVTHPS